MPRGCNSYDTAIEKDGGGIGLLLGFSEDDASSELKRLFTSSGLKGMLDENTIAC